MTCGRIKLPSGVSAIVCGSLKRCKCGNLASLACDWKVPERRTGTCDAPICDRCTTKPAPGKDLCKVHAALYEAWRVERGR